MELRWPIRDTAQLPADYVIRGAGNCGLPSVRRGLRHHQGQYREFTECLTALPDAYDYVPRVDEATDIPVGLGETTANINIVFGDANDAATLGGRVHDQSRRSTRHISVLAQLTDCSYGYCYARTVGNAVTDVDGRYVMTDMTPGDLSAPLCRRERQSCDQIPGRI